MTAEVRDHVTVEVVTPDDWQLWRALRHRALTEDPDAFGSTVELEATYDEDDWRARMDRGRTVVAFLDGQPVGMGGTFESEPAVQRVVSMWVAPEARRRGIGRLVLDDVVAAARAAGDRIELDVAEGNPARRIYERAGFVDTGRREPIRPGSSSMKVLMELP
jgi:ribosomal protein S18 acetylase RimI-like enzyme